MWCFSSGVSSASWRKSSRSQAQRLHRRAATDGGGARAALGQRGFAKAVAGLQGREDNFLAALVGLHDARAPRDENVKGIGGFTLPDEKIAELVVLLLQEGAQFLEVFLGQKLEER